MDRILIDELRVRCVLGVGEEERRDRQEVLISVALGVGSPSALTDELDGIVDYRVVTKRILAAAEASQFHLAEALAERVAQLCFDHPSVQEVQVRVEKPGALRFARSVAVEIVRQRKSE